jgi:REP-associated tyrosine transposase
MAHNFTQLYYHLTWATQGREPLITTGMEAELHAYIRHKCEEMRVLVHALNSMPDHVLLACTLPTKLALADFLEATKGSSAHFINHLPQAKSVLYWHSGYGALSFSKRDLPRIVAYIDGQKRHHSDKKLSPQMERCAE